MFVYEPNEWMRKARTSVINICMKHLQEINVFEA